MRFQPELGQMAWSNTEFYEHDAPELLIAVLDYIGEEMERVMGNLTQVPYHSPTGNVEGVINPMACFGVSRVEHGSLEDPWA